MLHEVMILNSDFNFKHSLKKSKRGEKKKKNPFLILNLHFMNDSNQIFSLKIIILNQRKENTPEKKILFLPLFITQMENVTAQWHATSVTGSHKAFQDLSSPITKTYKA